MAGKEGGGREDADDRNQCQIGRLIRRKEGWCISGGGGGGLCRHETERERDRQTDRDRERAV